MATAMAAILAISAPNGSPNGSHVLIPNVSAIALPNISAIALPNVSANAPIMNFTNLHPLQLDLPSPFLLHSVFVLAIVANSLLYISPLSLARRALKEQVDVKMLGSWLAPTYLIFAQSYLWACYGYSTGLSDLAHFNAFGALACMSYLGLIARCARPREVVQPAILMSICALVAFSIVVLMVCPSTLARSRAFGFAAILCNLGMIVAPLPDAARVVMTGELQEFPLAITAGSFLSSLLWAEYAILIHDQLYLIPNLIGTIVCGAELFVIYWIVYGGGGIGGAQSMLLEADNQPLMPRARGKKTDMSNCSELLSFFSSGKRIQHYKEDRSFYKDNDFGLHDHRRPYTPFGTFGVNEEGKITSSIPKPQSPSCRPATRSPFSAFGRAEGLDDSFEDKEDDFDNNFLQAQPAADERKNSFTTGMTVGYSDSGGAITCIL